MLIRIIGPPRRSVPCRPRAGGADGGGRTNCLMGVTSIPSGDVSASIPACQVAPCKLTCGLEVMLLCRRMAAHPRSEMSSAEYVDSRKGDPAATFKASAAQRKSSGMWRGALLAIIRHADIMPARLREGAGGADFLPNCAGGRVGARAGPTSVLSGALWPPRLLWARPWEWAVVFKTCDCAAPPGRRTRPPDRLYPPWWPARAVSLFAQQATLHDAVASMRPCTTPR